jgi:hypothetical protein
MGRQAIDEAQLAAMREEFREIEEALACCLVQHASLFEAVRAQVSPLWEALVDGKTFTRKPSYGLRLFAADRQTLVGVSPLYNRRTKTVDSGHHLFEVSGDVERYLSPVDPTPFYQLERRLTLRVQPGALPRWRSFCRSAVEDMATLVPTLEQFLRDPPAVLRRSTTHCAVCGRALTDGQSQARGIGPECVRLVSSFVTCTESIFGLVSAVPADEGTPLLASSPVSAGNN